MDNLSTTNAALRALEAAGFRVNDLTEDQRAVLAGLSQDEVNMLLSIQQRLDAAGPDVQAYRLGGAKGR